MSIVLMLVEEISHSPNQTVNLLSTNNSNGIRCEKFPYLLHTNLLLAADRPAPELGIEKIVITLSDVNDAVIGDATLQDLSLPFDGVGKPPPFAVIPIQLQIAKPGSLSIDIYHAAGKTARSWSIELGASPYRSEVLALPAAQVIRKGDVFNIPAFLAQAHESLIVIDPYLDGATALAHLASVPKATHVQILTSAKMTASYSAADVMVFRSAFSVFDVRISNDFHDRFVVLNGNEAFAFGYSLRNLGHRISYFSRLYDSTAHETLMTDFKSIWTSASAA